MAKLVNALLVIIILVTGSIAVANAQNAPQPANAPDVATKSDLQRATGTLAKQVQQSAAQQAAQLKDAEQKAEAQHKLDAANLAAQLKDAEQKAEAQREVEHAAEMRMFEIAGVIVTILVIGGGAIIIGRNRKTHSPEMESPVVGKVPVKKIPHLRENANDTEIKEHARAIGQVGQTLDYPVVLERRDPQNPGQKIFIGKIVGKVHKAGTSDQWFEFNGHMTKDSEKRFKVALQAFDGSQKPKGIHQVSA